MLGMLVLMWAKLVGEVSPLFSSLPPGFPPFSLFPPVPPCVPSDLASQIFLAWILSTPTSLPCHCSRMTYRPKSEFLLCKNSGIFGFTYDCRCTTTKTNVFLGPHTVWDSKANPNPCPGLPLCIKCRFHSTSPPLVQ